MALKRPCPTRRRQTGSVFVELAAVLPILIALSLGTLEFASALSEYRTVVNQARIAARYLSAKAPGQDHHKAVCLAKYGAESAPPCSGTPLLPALASATVTIQDASNAPATHRAQSVSSTGGSGVMNLVTVRISGYSHPLFTGAIIGGMLNDQTSITFAPIGATMRQAL
jgi:Flp pilus assembly protein TadG